eukprot:m.96097 g.96097  ORF g.96097 m.96097 type:complete len:78 (-) comp16635_c0_seq1:359-592(-)
MVGSFAYIPFCPRMEQMLWAFVFVKLERRLNVSGSRYSVEMHSIENVGSVPRDVALRQARHPALRIYLHRKPSDMAF